MATGAIRYWKDGRDAVDVILGLFDYPEGFNLSLRVNFVDGGDESEGLTFTGSEGTMEIGWTVTVIRVPREAAPGHMIQSFPKAMQEQIIAEYEKKYPPHAGQTSLGGEEKYVTPKGYSDSYDHFKNFSLQSVPVNPSSKTPSSATARRAPPCSRTSASSAAR